jgi:hypothetical protein
MLYGTIADVNINKKVFNTLLVIVTFVIIGVYHTIPHLQPRISGESTQTVENEIYWFELQRKSNIENLYKGIPGDKSKSIHVKSFRVKAGIPGQRPTPLPQLLGREYWLLTDKQAQLDNPETAPYFLTLDIPVSDETPFGPKPYDECNGQCDWILPGAFGLHGTGNNPLKLLDTDLGSSGCIRHSDEEVTYLYNLLDPAHEEIRYYIVDA